jgi:hypothetical protein
MSALAELQRNFAGAVRLMPAEVDVLGIMANGLAPARRVAVYRNHHRISLTGALAANFPTVARVLGEGGFPAIATDYVAFAPPTDPCLGAYGAGFAEFLLGDARLRELPYIGDVARLDWAFSTAERADDVQAFAPGHLAALASEGLAGLRLAAHPSATLIRSRYPLLRIRDLARGDAGVSGVSLDEAGVDLLVWRRDGVVDCAELDESGARLVAGLIASEPLSVAAGELPPQRLAPLLAQAVLTGAFAAPDP